MGYPCRLLSPKGQQGTIFIIRLKNLGGNSAHLRQVYFSMLRPILEYAAALWHPGITAEGIESIERIQKRAIGAHISQQISQRKSQTHEDQNCRLPM